MLIIFLFYSVNVVFSQDPVANLIQGRVVGIKVFQESSLTPIEIYFGIPYAAPPTGRLRFSPPERHSGWKRTYFAHRVAPSCPQHNQTENDSSENCLYLNIWTSRRVDGRPQPVIVILYSESWTGGALNLPCQELASEGVVVVTVSYRLHFLSFFTLKSAKARGNLALLDQYLALLWVHENISAFGGDPSSVTLLGHSAGADSVLHHIISPRATGLFHKAIIMSPHNTWQGISGDKTVTADEIARVSREVAQSVGCLNYTSRDEDVLYCMQNKPLKDFTISFTNKTLEKYMQPISDDFLPESIQYLPLSIVKVLKNPTNFYVPIDIMLGTTDLDSVKPLDSRFKSLITKSYKQIYDFSLEKIIPDILHALSLNNPETLQTLVNAVVWEYWDPERDALTSYKAVTSLAAMDTAVNSAVGSYYLAEKLSNHVSKTFVYRYSQPTKVDLQGNRLNFTGAVNGADLIALLGDAITLQVARRPSTMEEKQISKTFSQYIFNFIKFGSPTTEVNWPRFTRNDKFIFEICDDEINKYCTLKNVNRDIRFWLQYLPSLANTTRGHNGFSDRIVGDGGESRLRGGVYAMCAITFTLLLLLFTSGILLHRRRFYRPSSSDSQIVY